MPARKQPNQPPNKKHAKTAKAAEQKFGKAARSAAERGGKKPVIWQQAERSKSRAGTPMPKPPVDPFEPRPEVFEASHSRTLEAPVSDVYRAFNDPSRRGWCHERGYAVRASVAPRSLLLGFADGSIARVAIARKGNVRCTVTVQQAGLADGAAAERARVAWRGSLDRLAVMLDE